jgi:hypothetical protein
VCVERRSTAGGAAASAHRTRRLAGRAWLVVFPGARGVLRVKDLLLSNGGFVRAAPIWISPIWVLARCIAALVSVVVVVAVVLRWWSAATAREVERVWARWIVGSRHRKEVGLGRCDGWWAAVGGGRWSTCLQEKSLLRFALEPATAAPAGAVPFLGSVVVEVCSSSPWLGLQRETSDPLDRAMKASSRLSPPWGHRLGAGYDWKTGGWRHLRHMVS